MFESSADYLIEGSAIAAKIMNDNGIHPYTKDPRKIDQLRKTIAKVIDAGLLEIIRNSGLIRVFLYDDSKPQPDSMNGADGVCFWAENPENSADIRCVIGIGLSALERGESYLIFLFFHELTHGQLRYGEHNHDSIFHNLLDHILLLYDTRTGEAIENDYVGLPESQQNEVPGFRRSQR